MRIALLLLLLTPATAECRSCLQSQCGKYAPYCGLQCTCVMTGPVLGRCVPAN